MEDNDLQFQINVLKERVDALSNSSTIPLNLEQAFIARGFLKKQNTFASGQAQLNVSGKAYVPLPGLSVNCIGYGTYADGTSSDIGAAMAGDSGVLPNTVQLILDGIGTKVVNYVVFIPTDISQ